MKSVFVALILALVLAGPAEAARRNANPDIVEDALAYTLTDRRKSAQLLEDALEHEEGYRKNQELLVMAHAGEQRRLLGQYDQARDWFTRVLAQGNRGWELEAARLGLALVDAVDGLDPAVVTTLDEVRDKDALDTQNADRYLILAVRAARRNNAPVVRDYSRLALQYAEQDPRVAERVRAHLQSLVGEADRAVAAERSLLVEPEADDLLEPLTELQRAEKALADGEAGRVRELARQILDDPETSEADQRAAAYLEQRLDAGPVVDDRIGVLLPLSDRYESVGRQVRAALEFGFEQAGGRGHLVFEDSGASAETAVEALERLVLEQGVVAVLGPLLTEEAGPVAEAAEALRVPLIGLSQGLEPTEEQQWVYQAMVTPVDQVQALVDHVMGSRGMTAFAIFAPDNNYGHTAAEAFTEQVAEREGEVTITTFYDPEATDLIPFAEELGRKDYEARWREFEELKKEAEEKGGNPDRAVLPPTIDFEALFVPDNASRVPIAAAALAYEEFPIGDFQTTKDGDTIPMLGLSGWNHPALVNQGGSYVRGALFTDSFWYDAEQPPEDLAPFLDEWQAENGHAPSALEAVTVDAGRLVGAATRGDHEGREGFREALGQVETDTAVTGARGFDPETHKAWRSIQILTIDGEEGIVPVDTERVGVASDDE